MSNKTIKPDPAFVRLCAEAFTKLLDEAFNSENSEEKIEAFLQTAAACCQLAMQKSGDTTREFSDGKTVFILQEFPDQLLKQLTNHLEGILYDHKKIH